MGVKDINTLPAEKNKITYVIIPLLVLIVCLCLWYAMQQGGSTSVSSETGVWDLRGLSFDNGTYTLNGPVEYIPGALLTPEEFAAREDEVVIGYPQDAAQYATSRMRILLPSDGYYAFSCRSIDYAESLYVNGEWILDIGSPGETKETAVPNKGKITLTLKPEDGVIEIIQQASIFVHREGGGHAGWKVSSPDQLRSTLTGDFYESIQMGCFLALFFVHIILFLLLRSYRANLYFALFCLMWFLRTGVTGAKVFTDLFPWMSWAAKFRIEYLAFPVTAVLLVALLDALFPKILHKWFRYALCGVSAVIAAIFLFADTVFMSYALLWCEALYIPAILYIIVRFAMKLRSVTPEQGVFLAGAGLFFYAAVHDMLYYNDIRIVPIGDLSSVSMLLFTFCEAAAVFIATVREVENAKAQEQRLAAENAALDRLSRLRGSLMATVSHEMRTPLTVMSVYAQLAVENFRESGVDAQTTADLAMISGEARRLADMASGFLTLTEEQENTKMYGPVDMGAVIKQMARLCEPMLTKSKNRLELAISEELPIVSGNASECTQILWNLLDNAARHTQNGLIIISVRPEDGQIAVTVSDTGEGIPNELLSHVFERRVAGNGESTGLGLAICKEIVDAHGGTIAIESELNKGTAVTFSLPAGKAQITKPKAYMGEQI